MVIAVAILAVAMPVFPGGGATSSGTVHVTVTSAPPTTLPPPTGGVGSSGSGSGRPSSSGNGGGGSGSGLGLDEGYIECTSAACLGSEPAPVVVDPLAAAQAAFDEMPVHVPAPQTSPPLGRSQLVGMPTWFWVSPDEWVPVTARAELPGVWAETTATPVSARWVPGDGSSGVVCDGPGRPYSAGSRGGPPCGHTYIDPGLYTLRIEVTYAITWVASTGDSGSLAPMVLTTSRPIEVQQRQAVTD